MTSQSQPITPTLWFDSQAEAAASFYVSVFEDGAVGTTSHYDAAAAEISGQPEGSALTVEFEIEGQSFIALNGGPQFTFNPAISFMVNCPTKTEVDDLWEVLSAGGEALMPLDAYPFSERYGWTTDRYGVSWQLHYSADAQTRDIVPSLLFVGDQCGHAENAIEHYTSVFEDSAIGEIARYGPDQEPDAEGTIMYADFTLRGQRFAAMDSAHEHDFAFNEAISFVVHCDDQDAVDYYWTELTADGGEEGQCGWLTDRFGVSWQIVPTRLPDLLQNEDAEIASRVTEAMLSMQKLDIETLEAAAAE